MSDRLALANAIVDAGIERGKAERVASVIVDLVHDSVATKADVQALGGELRAEIAATRTALTSDIAAIKADLKASEAAIRGELRAEIGSVRALLASETARLDTRVERLDARLKPLADQIMLRLGALMVVLTGVILAALRYLPPPHGG
jgi:hypothetical protein